MYDVGIEIDYEESANPRLPELEHFIRTYRSAHAFEQGTDPSSKSMHSSWDRLPTGWLLMPLILVSHHFNKMIAI